MIRNTGNGYKDDNGNQTTVPKVILPTPEKTQEIDERYKLVVHGVSGIEEWVDTYKEYK